ncbi:glycosyltransferase family 4 protein [Alkalilimnicola ehrlichii MLHE-1]|uniref:Glycosyl transferase, group 1 n=1 Tax=Alkalilimnicola ehrlichii (strain ATCC BAA-1101 / DSM 17681 / MLHE-1) TaxID=187272 RepID=Q0A4V4_ALKEH|nr:glycosyltransferase family 4 protein [Alkalilimnicola ehrlichii]ABI58133.1 glycosyl transferase, group 1 [Alkalilimnicola ehrlichii MLHE-1]
MHLAFALFKYFPHGGLQRNFRRITELALERGHRVDVYTLAWSGWTPEHPNLTVEVVKVPGWRNHTRYRRFGTHVQKRLADNPPDRVVGFNKMPGLDVYYNADPCFVERAQARHPLYRWSGRYRQHAAFEQAVFRADARNHILLLSEAEKPLFQRWYATPDDRFHLMPPYVSTDRFAGPEAPHIGAGLRRELGLGEADRMLLMVGSDFRRKGVDRSIRALAALPESPRRRTHLYVLGKGRAATQEALARGLGVADQVHFLQGRDDVARFLFAADLLLHPAYQENTGTAIVEAIAAGLPALVTGNCGYAFHIERAGSGRVLPPPFTQAAMDEALASMIDSPEQPRWREYARTYARRTELGSRAEHALRVIEGPRYGEHG